MKKYSHILAIQYQDGVFIQEIIPSNNKVLLVSEWNSFVEKEKVNDNNNWVLINSMVLING